MMYLFFDTETNGLPIDYKGKMDDVNNWPRVAQLAWALYNEDGNRFISFSGLIEPHDWTIPTVEELRKIGHKNPNFFVDNNMSTERCQKEGWPMIKVMGHFINALNDCTHLIAHNIRFDLPVMACEMIRLNMKAVNKPAKICTMLQSTEVCKIPSPNGMGFKWPKLEELHRFLFNCDFDGAHDAGFDVAATAKCFFELKKRGLIVFPDETK